MPIKRVKRNKKKTTTGQKILGGIGIGSSLLGGAAGFSKNQTQIQPTPPTQIVGRENQNQKDKKGGKSASEKIKDLIKNVFGIQKAKADSYDWEGYADGGSSISNSGNPDFISEENAAQGEEFWERSGSGSATNPETLGQYSAGNDSGNEGNSTWSGAAFGSQDASGNATGVAFDPKSGQITDRTSSFGHGQTQADLNSFVAQNQTQQQSQSGAQDEDDEQDAEIKPAAYGLNNVPLYDDGYGNLVDDNDVLYIYNSSGSLVPSYTDVQTLANLPTNNNNQNPASLINFSTINNFEENPSPESAEGNNSPGFVAGLGAGTGIGTTMGGVDFGNELTGIAGSTTRLPDGQTYNFPVMPAIVTPMVTVEEKAPEVQATSYPIPIPAQLTLTPDEDKSFPAAGQSQTPYGAKGINTTESELQTSENAPGGQTGFFNQNLINTTNFIQPAPNSGAGNPDFSNQTLGLDITEIETETSPPIEEKNLPAATRSIDLSSISQPVNNVPDNIQQIINNSQPVPEASVVSNNQLTQPVYNFVAPPYVPPAASTEIPDAPPVDIIPKTPVLNPITQNIITPGQPTVNKIPDNIQKIIDSSKPVAQGSVVFIPEMTESATQTSLDVLKGLGVTVTDTGHGNYILEQNGQTAYVQEADLLSEAKTRLATAPVNQPGTLAATQTGILALQTKVAVAETKVAEQAKNLAGGAYNFIKGKVTKTPDGVYGGSATGATDSNDPVVVIEDKQGNKIGLYELGQGTYFDVDGNIYLSNGKGQYKDAYTNITQFDAHNIDNSKLTIVGPNNQKLNAVGNGTYKDSDGNIYDADSSPLGIKIKTNGDIVAVGVDVQQKIDDTVTKNLKALQNTGVQVSVQSDGVHMSGKDWKGDIVLSKQDFATQTFSFDQSILQKGLNFAGNAAALVLAGPGGLAAKSTVTQVIIGKNTVGIDFTQPVVTTKGGYTVVMDQDSIDFLNKDGTTAFEYSQTDLKSVMQPGANVDFLSAWLGKGNFFVNAATGSKNGTAVIVNQWMNTPVPGN